MELIIHRINKIQELKKIPQKYGCEIDIRAYKDKLILNHEPFQNGDYLTDYLDNYSHGTLILNIKEAGIENIVLSEVRKRNIKSFFLLDVEFPYIYNSVKNGERAIAIRYSEDESIENVKKYANRVDWIWIDVNSMLPLSKEIIDVIKPFKSCLVCPERWGRPYDIDAYIKRLHELYYLPTAVMTSLKFTSLWERLIQKH